MMSQSSHRSRFQILRPWWRSLLIGLVAILLIGLLMVSQHSHTSQAQGGDRISQTELLGVLDTPFQPLILDVRTAEEYAEGYIPGAVNIHFRDLPNHLEELRAQNPSSIVVYCEVGVRAGLAEQTLQDADFDSILHLEGDMREWRRQNRPVATVD